MVVTLHGDILEALEPMKPLDSNLTVAEMKQARWRAVFWSFGEQCEEETLRWAGF